MRDLSWLKRSLKKRTRRLTLKRRLSKQKREPWRKYWLNIPREEVVKALTLARIIRNQLHSKKLSRESNEWSCCHASSLHFQDRVLSSSLRVLTHKWTSQMATRRAWSGNLSNKNCRDLMRVIENCLKSRKWLPCLSGVSVCITLACSSCWRKSWRFCSQTAT